VTKIAFGIVARRLSRIMNPEFYKVIVPQLCDTILGDGKIKG
jgi:hypothetical protein